MRGGDQPDVAERLREVAELLVVLGVDLLGQQPEVIRVADELVEAAPSARSTSPAWASARASQNEQITNVPSSPLGPSAFRPSPLR